MGGRPFGLQNLVPLIPRGSIPEQVEGTQGGTGNWLTEVQLEKWPLEEHGSGSVGGSSSSSIQLQHSNIMN